MRDPVFSRNVSSTVLFVRTVPPRS